MNNDKDQNEVLKENHNSLATTNDNLPSTSSVNDFQFITQLAANLENMTAVAKVFIKGGLCPIKNENDFVVAVTTGMQLGLPLTTAINNIFVVNNKPAIATHLMRALVLKAGITYNKVYDYEPMFAYYEAEVLLNGEKVAKKIDIPDPNDSTKTIKSPIQRGIATMDQIEEDSMFFIGRKEVDRITKYVFERQLAQPDGTFKNMQVVSSFTMSDAFKAGLSTKDTYKNYPARMLDARAFTIGGREIASDVLFGMYSIAEIADSSDIPYTMSANFEETIDTTAEVVN